MTIKSKYILIINLLYFTTAIFNAQNRKKEKTLYENWGDYDNHFAWYANGSFSFTESNSEKIYSAFGQGTYIYQAETGEIFAQIISLNQKQNINDKTTYNCSFKRYFKIIEKNDSIITVLTILPEYEIDWKLNDTGKNELLSGGEETNELPFIIKTYKNKKDITE